MADDAEILSKLASYVGTKKNLRLLNVYRGLPISYDAAVLSVTGQSATFRVHPYQATCLELYPRTFIIGSELGGVLRANASQVNIINETAVFASFVSVEDTIGQRMRVRVCPKEQISVELRIKRTRVGAEMIDISSLGIGVTTTATYYGRSLFLHGNDLFAEFTLPSANLPLRVGGRIVYVNRDLGSIRLGIRFHVNIDPAMQNALELFLTQRQAEIQRELSEMYDLFYRIRQEGSSQKLQMP